MRGTVITRFEVRDFELWKRGFDAATPGRRELGFLGARFYRDADDPARVVVLLDFDDLDAGRAYFSDPALLAKMHSAGVVGTFEFHYVREVGA